MTRGLHELLLAYLDNHCQASDQEGMSVLCECKLCLETREALRALVPCRAVASPEPLMLAAYLAFIRGVDIPETVEQARATLVERTLRAEATLVTLTDALGRLVLRWRAEDTDVSSEHAETLADLLRPLLPAVRPQEEA